jgi:hypothetical protein
LAPQSGEAKVDELDIVVVVDYDVFSFDVAMDNAASMAKVWDKTQKVSMGDAAKDVDMHSPTALTSCLNIFLALDSFMRPLSTKISNKHVPVTDSKNK